MEILRIEALDDEAGDDLRSLAEWLGEDEDLNEVEIIPVKGTPKPGQMGGALEALSALAQQKEAITAVITAVATWLTASRTSTRLRVKRGNKEVEIVGGSVKNAEEAAKRILRELDQ